MIKVISKKKLNQVSQNKLKMGNRASRRTTSQKQEINKVVEKVIESNKKNLENLKQSVSTTFSTDTSVATDIDKTTSSLLHFIDVASQQLERKGANLTKSDLLAIIINLEPTAEINSLNKLSVTDLNAMIRNIVYDPVRCEKRFKRSLEQGKPLNIKETKSELTILEKAQANKKTEKNPYSLQ